MVVAEEASRSYRGRHRCSRLQPEVQVAPRAAQLWVEAVAEDSTSACLEASPGSLSEPLDLFYLQEVVVPRALLELGWSGYKGLLQVVKLLLPSYQWPASPSC